jgi:NAD(P)H-dependent FMN reductase
MSRFLFLLSSTRHLGNSEQLAYCAASPLPDTATQQWVHLLDYPVPAFVDRRHSGSVAEPSANVDFLLNATLEATDLVLVAPLYLFMLPAPAKQYLDHWCTWLYSPSLTFREQMKGKTLWAIVVGNGDRADANPLHDALVLVAKKLGMHWGGMLYGTGSRPNDIQEDSAALLAAKTFFLGNLAEQHPLQGHRLEAN